MSESAVQTNAGDRWQLEYDDLPDEEFPDGLRLSTDCLARRLIEPLERERYHEFPEPLSKRGHGFERVLQEWLFKKHGVVAHREIVVPWDYGESHLDLWIPRPSPAFDTDGLRLQLELKANKEAQVKPENVRQVHRQIYAVELCAEAGKMLRLRVRDADGEWQWHELDPVYLLDAQWRVMVIDPLTWAIPDSRGVRVSLTDDRRRELAAEWDVMREFMARSIGSQKWDIHSSTKMPPCTCSKCFRPELLELDEDAAEHAALFLEAHAEVSFADDEKRLQSNWLIERLAPALPDDEGGSFAGHGFKVTVKKPTAKGTRSVIVTRSEAQALPNL